MISGNDLPTNLRPTGGPLNIPVYTTRVRISRAPQVDQAALLPAGRDSSGRRTALLATVPWLVKLDVVWGCSSD